LQGAGSNLEQLDSQPCGNPAACFLIQLQ